MLEGRKHQLKVKVQGRSPWEGGMWTNRMRWGSGMDTGGKGVCVARTQWAVDRWRGLRTEGITEGLGTRSLWQKGLFSLCASADLAALPQCNTRAIIHAYVSCSGAEHSKWPRSYRKYECLVSVRLQSLLRMEYGPETPSITGLEAHSGWQATNVPHPLSSACVCFASVTGR